jgi:general stress protein YciG
MPGNKQGGKTAATTNKARHGNDFYKVIGSKGGKRGHTGGFAANPVLAQFAGKKGGLMSTRKKNMSAEEKTEHQKNAIAEYKRLIQAYDDDTLGTPTNA